MNSKYFSSNTLIGLTNGRKDVLGNIYYTFKGVYRCIKHTEDTIEYERISSKIFLSDYL
ncbi:restriction endonuclease [Streptococcus phage phi-SsuFJSM8_rum]|nr:restriction endonuclease [Streptococcus phage phi-SsuFJSM8_rum]